MSIHGPQDWTQLSLRVKAPANAAFLRVEFRLNGPGTLWADDLAVSPVEVAPPPPPPPPASTAAPIVSGVAQVGQTLATTNGGWSGQPTRFDDQWLACTDPSSISSCAAILDATSAHYTLTTGELGEWIRTRIRATGSGGSADAFSNALGPVVRAPSGSGNLAHNPDVELNPGPYYFTDGPCSFSWATDASHSPTHALKIYTTTSTPCRWMTETRAIAAIPGTSYDVSAWLKTLGTASVTYLSINFWDKTETYIPATIDAAQTIHGPQDWTQINLRATAPANAAFLRVEFRLNGPGTLWADDLAVTVTGSAPLIPAIDLGNLGGTQSFATGINEAGQVIGYSSLVGSYENHAFSWTPAGGMVDLGTFGGVNSRPNAINDSGQVVGEADPLTGFPGRPFSWTATGGMVDISPFGAADINNSGQIVGGEFLRTAAGGSVDLGTLGGTNGTSANAINDSGQVVGSSWTSGNAAQHAFSWTAAGGMVDLGTLGGTSSVAVAVNDSGQVVGYSYTIGKPDLHAFAWTAAGGMVDLGTLGGTSSIAVAINDSGQVVGYSPLTGNGSMRAFSWTAKSGMVDLGNFGGTFTTATDVNNSGEVVGYSYTIGNAGQHAFSWTAKGGMVDLGAVGGTNSTSYAYAVNDNGQVVGSTNSITGHDVVRASHAVLWQP